MIFLNKQRGEVSLFVVVFSMLLITVVTVSFVRIMIQDQQQASSTDLSQSAYDSAQAGVEDAKRAILRYQNICDTGSVADCSAARSKIDSTTNSSLACNASVETLSDVADAAAKSKNGEVNVQTGSTNNALDQAYTCVKINLETDDYIGVLDKDASKFIPIVGVSDFDTIKIEWFSVGDLQATTTSANIPAFVASSSPLLLNQNNWVSSTVPNRPPIMRAQLIQFDNTGFSLSDFDGNNISGGSNNTLFLYPSNIVDTSKKFTNDMRKTAVGTSVPTQVYCNDLSAAESYACSATITLPKTVVNNNHTQYLNLSSIYKGAHFRITLLNGTTPVKFNSVQPEVDSTGRTNDLFRRIQARVELTDVSFPYPTSAVHLTGNLCKEFIITDNIADYQAGSCTP